ncbi:hypothetical protein ACFWUQ_10040 [Streptomyces sp. NPDC058662]|uniref:hypothetical protein n=1 Tax=Streptomyces sp. NPDC058662 TaxID=3346583 RepID=UPI00364BF34A
MTTADHLDTIDRLRVREFPAEPDRSGGRSSGPGHHLVEVGRTGGCREDDGSAWIAASDQISAEYGALTQALSDRWGEPQVFALESLAVRAAEGEEIPEPWAEVSASTDHVQLWRAGDHWLVAYVTRGDAYDPYLLMAGVTVVDPP